VHQAHDIQPFSLDGTLTSSSTCSNAERGQIYRRGPFMLTMSCKPPTYASRRFEARPARSTLYRSTLYRSTGSRSTLFQRVGTNRGPRLDTPRMIDWTQCPDAESAPADAVAHWLFEERA